MHSIFWKIFLSFWLSMVLIIGVAVVSSFRFAADRMEAIDEFDRRETLFLAASAFNDDGIAGFKEWLSDAATLPADQTLYLIDSQGNEALNRALPRKMRSRGFLKRLRGSEGRRHTSRLGGGRRLEFIAADGTEYRPVFGLKPPSAFGIFGLPKMALFILCAGMLISAFMCYLLTRYLTRPLAGMVKASHELANGNLSSRVGESAYRGDEIGKLAQQFDNMASKFEHQIDSRQTLFRNISHELRSPLARIKVAVELARRKPEDVTPQLQRIGSEADNIEHLVSQVLALVKVQQHDSYEIEPVNLVEIIDKVVGDARFEGLPNNKTVLWQPLDKLIIVNGHAGLLHSAIENITRNAINYTAENTSIELSLIELPASVSLTVTDHGPGIEAHELKSIFEPFYRSAHATDMPGSGIGLAIAAQAVEIMAGSVSAANVDGGGLQVKVVLPPA